MKKIVITGACGFIGSCLVAYLNEKNISNLLLVDDLKYANKWKNLVNKDFIDLISKNDFIDYLDNNLSDISAIIHLGACSDTMETDSDYLLENNFRYSKKIALRAIPNNIRFIYASSAATYGYGEKGFSDERFLDLSPINMYAFSKQLFDIWMYKNNYLNKAVALKYFNVFGPNEYHKEHMASMIYKMFGKVYKDATIELFKSNTDKYKDGEQIRDFIYVKDAVRITALFLDELKDKHGIFNVGTGRETTWNELAYALFKAVGKSPSINYIDMPKSLSKQYQNYTKAEMKKFLNAFPNYDFYTIEDSVKDYVQNYLLGEKRW